MVHEPATMDGPSIMQCLLQRVEHEAGVRRARDPPANDPPGIGVDHKGDVDKAGPGRDIGEVGEPEDIRPWRLELAVDVIQRAWRGLVADRGFDGFAADDPLQTHVPHQSRHRTTGNIEALALELSSDLAHAIDPEILIEDAPNLDPQRGILAGAGRAAWRDRAVWPH